MGPLFVALHVRLHFVFLDFEFLGHATPRLIDMSMGLLVNDQHLCPFLPVLFDCLRLFD